MNIPSNGRESSESGSRKSRWRECMGIEPLPSPVRTHSHLQPEMLGEPLPSKPRMWACGQLPSRHRQGAKPCLNCGEFHIRPGDLCECCTDGDLHVCDDCGDVYEYYPDHTLLEIRDEGKYCYDCLRDRLEAMTEAERCLL